MSMCILRLLLLCRLQALLHPKEHPPLHLFQQGQQMVRTLDTCWLALVALKGLSITYTSGPSVLRPARQHCSWTSTFKAGKAWALALP